MNKITNQEKQIEFKKEEEIEFIENEIDFLKDAYLYLKEKLEPTINIERDYLIVKKLILRLSKEHNNLIHKRYELIKRDELVTSDDEQELIKRLVKFQSKKKKKAKNGR